MLCTRDMSFYFQVCSSSECCHVNVKQFMEVPRMHVLKQEGPFPATAVIGWPVGFTIMLWVWTCAEGFMDFA